MTIVETARSHKTAPYMRRIASDEGVPVAFIRKGLAEGTIVIPANTQRSIARPCGIGEGIRTKINANIGTSIDSGRLDRELKKLHAAVDLGADTVMDLSTGPGIKRIRKEILRESPVPVGTVPIYQTVVEGKKRYSSVRDIPREAFIETLEEQAEEGVDFFTIHAGITRKTLETLKRHPRILDIVSRGGAFLAEWMLANGRENPYYGSFDRVLAILKRYDVTISLGDGLRPGSIIDATDDAQVAELMTLGDLQKIASEAGVQVIIEGPGHVPINQIEANVKLEKSICRRAPFYVLGPLVTDVAPGYDHIVGAIGGAVAAAAGADFLCYVTPSEHLRLPTIEDVKEGVIASKIAAHAADIAKGIAHASDNDRAISKARKDRNWRKQFAYAIDKEKPRKYRACSMPSHSDVCTMCGDYCSIKQAEGALKR